MTCGAGCNEVLQRSRIKAVGDVRQGFVIHAAILGVLAASTDAGQNGAAQRRLRESTLLLARREG